MDNNENNINQQTNIVEDVSVVETEDEKPKKASIWVPIVISIITLIINVPIIVSSFKEASYGGLRGFAILGGVAFIIIAGAILSLTWIIYLIVLTIQKKKYGEKNWFVPLIIVILIIIGPRLYLFFATSDTANKERLSTARPEIVSYEKLSEMPILDGYKVLGEELDEFDVYSNIDKYEGTKVLVKGIPSLRGNRISYAGREVVTIYNDNGLLYEFTFIDKSSEFSKDNRIFFGTENTLPDDYYAYIYGTIKSVQTESSGGNDYKVINIRPEKIYYTLSWDLFFEEEPAIEYSECAKEGKTCSEEEIKEGQVVNVSVNDKKDLDFYVLKDDGKKLLLYGYKTIGKSEYITEDDTLMLLKKYGEKRNSTDNSIKFFMHNYWGPYTLFNNENEITKDWVNIKPISYYSYTSTYSDIFKSLKINDGKVTITSFKNNSITLDGNTRARVLSESDIDEDMYEMLGKSCLRTIGTREGSNCDIWIIDSQEELFGITLHISYNDGKYDSTMVRENIHEENYIVPVIEVDKSDINNK